MSNHALIMNEIDLRRFDLNLLVVFDVLMIERSVTRAAERLGRTQSAVSHSLSRLREQFGDPLLIKGGMRMQPTAFARPDRTGALDAWRDPARTVAGACLRPRDVASGLSAGGARFLVDAVRRPVVQLRAEAPFVSVEWIAPREPTLLDVAEGLIDVAIVPAELRWPQGVVGEAVGALGWRCFGRRGHAAFSDWGRESWARWPHLVVRVGDSLTSPVNVAAAAAGLERTIAGWVPNFSAIAPILAGSEMLATLPTLAMTETLHAYRLDRREVPFPIAPLPHAMVWCNGRSRDPGLIWLRDRMRPIVKRNFAS